MNTETYRVYDTEENKWITDECVLSPKGEIYKIDKIKFGATKLELMHNPSTPSYIDKSRCVIHRCINIPDKTGTLIYEGDILRNNKGLIGTVFYSIELGAFVLLNYKNNKYYALSKKVCKHFKIIGNTIDDKELLYM